MYGFKITICSYLSLHLTVVTLAENTPTGNDCFLNTTTLTCSRVPTDIPDKIREVFLRDINIENDVLDFSGRGWENITLLNIQSVKGVSFKDRERQPVFKELSKLRRLEFHGKNLNHLDEETLLGLPDLETLDLSYCNRLKFSEVKKLFTLNSSLVNLTSLLVGFLDNTPVTLDEYFITNLGKRPVETLGLQGLSLFKVAFQSMHGLCNSVKLLNLSGSIYFPDLDLEGKGLISCPSLRTLDMSRTPTRRWALKYQKPFKERKVDIGLEYYPSLATIYADDLFFDVPGFTVRENGVIYRFKDSRNLANLKHLYIRHNKIQWFNVTCDNCDKFGLELIDVSSNGLEYISPNFLRNVTTLEEINFSDNKLQVMQYFSDFEVIFKTFIKLRKINLSDNEFSFLPKHIFASNGNLESIDLARNKLETLFVSLKHIHKLKHLSLRQNRIKTLNEQDMSHFSILFSDGKFEIDLSGMTFTCDCETSHFVRWLYSNFIQGRLKVINMACVLESSVITIDYSALEKTQYLCERTSVIIVSSCLSLCYVTVIIVTVIFARRFIERKRIEEKRKDFLAKFKADRENNRYLIFIIFCQKEEALVHEVVMPVLSDCLNKLLNTEEKLIGVGYNEYRLGLPLIVETERCIRQSSAVVILHSQASGKCVRSKREVKIAYEKDKPMAIINKGFVDANLATPILEAVIAKSPNVSIRKQGNKFLFASNPMEFCEALLDDIVGDI